MKTLIPLLAVVLAGCAMTKPAPRSEFGIPPGTAAQRRDSPATLVEPFRQERAAQAEVMSTARKVYLDAHPELSARDRELVQRGSYAIGWPRERVTASIGEPQRISQTVSAFGQVETWIYRSGIELLQFVNGVLTSFHVER